MVEKLVIIPTKSWLLVKLCASQKVESVFFGTKIKITTEGERYLGGSVGTQKFKDLYITTKVNAWIAAIEPQSAYSAFTAGFKHKIT